MASIHFSVRLFIFIEDLRRSFLTLLPFLKMYLPVVHSNILGKSPFFMLILTMCEIASDYSLENILIILCQLPSRDIIHINVK